MDEQQVHLVIRYLPSSWEYMKVNMTYNDNIKTFDDIKYYLVFNDEWCKVSKSTEPVMYEAKTFRAQGSKSKGKRSKKHGGRKGNVEHV